MKSADLDTIQMFMALDAIERKDQERPLDPPDTENIDWCRDCGAECEFVLCEDCKMLRRSKELSEVLKDIGRTKL